MAEYAPDETGSGGRVAGADRIAVGVFDAGTLSDGLAAIHRAGLGTQARVLDAARGSLDGQLQRAGLRLTLPPLEQAADTKLVVVAAPGRGAAAADALSRAGARTVYLVARDRSDGEAAAPAWRFDAGGEYRPEEAGA